MGQNLKEEIQKIIYYDTDISFERTPGYVIGVVIGDSSYIFGYGSISKDSLKIPDENTIFELGSLTKVFTASLVQRLVEKGKMDFDSSLNHYLPINLKNKTAKELTLVSLLSHTSGLPKMPLEFGVKEKEDNNPYAFYTKRDLQEFYQNYFFNKKKKGDYLYSHLNYDLVELAIENACKKSFEEVLQEELLNPLNLQDTRLHLNQAQQKRLATGYSLSHKTTPAWSFQSFQASQALKSTAHDLMAFLKVNLHQQHTDFSESFSHIHQAIAKTSISKHVSVGKGWHILKNRRYYSTIAHSGSTSGHRVFMGFIKETKTGVVILSNSAYGMNGLGHLIIRLINQNWKKKK